MDSAKSAINNVFCSRPRPRNPEEVYFQALHYGVMCPESEAMIVKDPKWAFKYAAHIMGQPWPEAEPAIIKDPALATKYAKHVLKRRWPEAEAAISRSDHAYVYLAAFPDAKDEWVSNGWIDWLET